MGIRVEDVTNYNTNKNIELISCRHIVGGKSHYLDMKWRYENYKGVFELSVPKINITELCKLPNIISIREHTAAMSTSVLGTIVDLPLEPVGKENYYYKIECVEERPKKMTLAEIEKQLGYKIELIEERSCNTCKYDDLSVLEKTPCRDCHGVTKFTKWEPKEE